MDRLRVLIIEDSKDDLLLLLRELRRGGYEPIYQQVSTQAEMEIALQSQEWDLIIADYVMPHFSGMDALKLMKEKELDLPFILLSGNISEDIAVQAMKAGAHDYIVKGNLARLLPAIARELREATMRGQRRQMQREMVRLDRLNLIGEMAAGISHEVRNPLTTVRGFLQMLGKKESCVQYQEYFQLMIEELDRANSIITEFLSIGKNQPTQFAQANLNEILEALLPLIQADAVGLDKHVVAELNDLPPLWVNAKEIRQIILNLSRNGLEAMPRGGCLTIGTRLAGDQVILFVQDQGPGIPAETLEKLGTPFFTTKEQGTGLGLVVCYGIAARHQATIHIDTSTQGTTFSVCFPVEKRAGGKNEANE